MISEFTHVQCLLKSALAHLNEGQNILERVFYFVNELSSGLWPIFIHLIC